MSRNGAGTFSLAEPPFVFGDVISETAVNSDLSDIANGLTASIANDGQTPILANLPMSNYKHTGVLSTSGSGSRTEYTSGGTVQDNVIMDAGVTAGSSTVYTATLSPAITAYVDKACYRVQIDETCGATPTINFNSVGAKKMYFNIAGVATQVTTGDILANQILILRYDTALDAAAGGFWVVNQPYPLAIASLTETTTVDYYNDKLPIYDASASANRNVRPEYLLGLFSGYIFGLALSNNGSDPNNDIDIAIGRATDNTVFALMELTSGLTKRLDANWAVGTNQGGLDTGAKANSTWYHVWLIQRPDTGVVDALFSTSATAPTMPANYTIKRRIGAILTDGSGNILAFVQRGDNFRWTTPPAASSASYTAYATATPVVPTGIIVEAYGNGMIGTGGGFVNIRPVGASDGAPSSTATPGITIGSLGASGVISGGTWNCFTNTSAQIEIGGNTTTFYLVTIGWIDRRGRDS